MNKKEHIWLWTAIGVAFIGALYLLKSILMPFFAGLLVAYAMNPVVQWFEKWGITRGPGTALVILSFFFSIGLLVFIAIPFLQAELLYLASRVPYYGERLLATIQPFLDTTSFYTEFRDGERLRILANSYMGDMVSWGIRFLAGILTNSLALATLISLIVVTPVVAFYCLRDWDKIITALDSWLPRPYENILRHLFREINSTLGGFARGQVLVCLTVGIYYFVALTLANLDFSFVVSLIIGIMAFIPYVGALVGFTLSMGIAFSQFSDWGSIGVIASLFLGGQILEGYVLVPYFVGDRIGLHPVWVIFSLLAGGVLYGFVGILFALPVAATLGVLVRYGLQAYLKSPYYLGKFLPSSSESHAATLTLS